MGVDADVDEYLGRIPSKSADVDIRYPVDAQFPNTWQSKGRLS